MRSGSEIFAIDAHCSHYHGPLAEGLVVGDEHPLPLAPRLFRFAHRRSDPRAGADPARGLAGRARGRSHLRSAESANSRSRAAEAPVDAPDKIVIVGGGAAGFAAAEMLRRQEFRGSIVMLSNDTAPPVDRPNLSKDYLAGSAPEDWLPLRPDSFYAEADIDLRLNTEVDLDRYQGAQRRHRRWRHRSLRPPAAGDRCRAGAAADPGRRPAACPYAALACGLPGDHRRP